ncbi:glycerophosphodiester phosphodiesterase [Bifidobacterium choloepi]|uniref:Glycerophosphodiester phosphodiesterase n=1 Tax=Bifidobacterium choloepi TaxID=2614131 RepID=A0A6I5N2J8_9BIFI|nr:glycerophosphodiester phosphodiesterase [Bifidobacterium choloepi]NEG69879.1 glycerophosphodiester phosphodiesterase [Bifidobacterium choloepi]
MLKRIITFVLGLAIAVGTATAATTVAQAAQTKYAPSVSTPTEGAPASTKVVQKDIMATVSPTVGDLLGGSSGTSDSCTWASGTTAASSNSSNDSSASASASSSDDSSASASASSSASATNSTASAGAAKSTSSATKSATAGAATTATRTFSFTGGTACSAAHGISKPLSAALNEPLDYQARTKIFAHRGFTDKHELQNTFQAFDAAIAAGNPQVELDIRTSKDGVFYISHDATMRAVAGVNKKISELTSTQIDQITQKNGEKMHRLSELFDRYGSNLIYLIEFKEKNVDIDAFYRLLEQYPTIIDHVEVHSFYAEPLAKLDRLLPNMFKQLLVSSREEINADAGLYFVDSFGVNQKVASKAVIKQIHGAGKEIWVWTVDSPTRIAKFLSEGVDGVITDTSKAVGIAKVA